MIRKYAFLVALFLGFSPLYAAEVQLSYCTFYSPASGSYVEVYLSFVADDIHYITSEHGYYGEIDVTYSFDNGEGQVQVEQFVVQTLYVQDSNQVLDPFVVQHRIFLKNGDYIMKVGIRDMHTNQPPVETNQHVNLSYNDQMVALSDIELYQSASPSENKSMFQKHGFEIIPYAYDIIPQQMNQVGFYAELYNADKFLGKDSAFLITYYLENYESGVILPEFRGFSRKNAAGVNIIMGKFLLSELSSGNYHLKIDVLNRNNSLVTSKKIAFHKQNPVFVPADAYGASFVDRYKSADSLAEHIRYLQPISDRLQWEFAENQLADKDLGLMKKYFLNFWEQRDPDNPEKAWYKYLQQVNICMENFTTPMRPGYLSDRGYRYLKYGPPNDRYESFDEPQAFPYEVWYYYKVNLQSNRMIIFYNKSQVLNDYTILHSDINGELYNKDWNLELHRMSPGFIDDEKPYFMDHFGNKSKDWMNLPR